MIEKCGDVVVMEYVVKFDKYDGVIILSDVEIEVVSVKVLEKLKWDI